MKYRNSNQALLYGHSLGRTSTRITNSELVSLSAGECITKVEMYIKQIYITKIDIVGSIRFTTTLNGISKVYGWYGPAVSPTHSHYKMAEGTCLKYVTGRAGVLVDQLNFYFLEF